MSKFDKTCIVCKNNYKYCSTCAKYKNKPRWMQSFCSENCLEVYRVLRDYRNGNLTIKETKEKLEMLDTSRNEYYSNSFKTTYEEIMTADIVEEIEETDVVVEDVAVADADNAENNDENVEDEKVL